MENLDKIDDVLDVINYFKYCYNAISLFLFKRCNSLMQIVYL